MKNFIEVTTFEGVELINTAAIQRIYIDEKTTCISLHGIIIKTTESYSEIIALMEAAEDR